MLSNLYWGLFTQSGNIDAYLAYKRTEADDAAQDAEPGAAQSDRRSRGQRYGDF